MAAKKRPSNLQEEEYAFLRDIFTLFNEDTTDYTDEQLDQYDEEIDQWIEDAEAFLDSDDVLLHRPLLHQLVCYLSEDFDLYTEEQREDYEARETVWTQKVEAALEDMPKFCPQCGQTLPIPAKFCFNCGYQLLIHREDTQPVKPIDIDKNQIVTQGKISTTKQDSPPEIEEAYLLQEILVWADEDYSDYTDEQLDEYHGRGELWKEKLAAQISQYSTPDPLLSEILVWQNTNMTHYSDAQIDEYYTRETAWRNRLAARLSKNPKSETEDALTQEIRAWIETDLASLTDEQRQAHAAKLFDLTERAGPDRIQEILEEYRPDEEDETALVPLPADGSYIRILTVSVPPSTKWQPEIAQSLIMNLFDISLPKATSLVLQIRASLNQIRWTIEAPRDVSEVVRRTLYSLYPQAQVEETSKTSAPVGSYRFDIHTGHAYMVPFSAAEDFTKTDPLAAVVGSLVNLEPDEEVIYELAITHPSFNYFKYGEKYITQSRIGVLNFIVPVAMIHGAAMAASGTTRSDKYAPIIQKKLRTKIHNLLKDVDFSLKVKAHSPERAKMIANGVVPSLAPYSLENLNFPVPAGKGTHPMVLSAQEVAALWHLPTELCQSPGIVWAATGVSPLPTVLLGHTSGILLGENHYQGRTHPVYLSYPDRVTHVNLIGKTRVGKSTLLHHMAHADIAAGKGVGVIDPHGDLVDAILATSIPPGREQDVVLFDTRDQEYPIGLNLLKAPPGVSLDAVAGQTLAVIRKMFSDQWSATRMESVLDAAIRALVTYEGATIQDIPKLLLDPPFRHQVLSGVKDPTTLEFWYDEFEVESGSQQREFARPITHRLRKFYRDPAIRSIVCQLDSLDFRAILNNQKIFLACLSGISEVDAETLGALLISKIQLAAMSRASLSPQERTPYYLYIDEVQNFITTSLSKMFSEAGKYGLSLVVANQFLKQLEGETLEAILGNVGTTIIFRVGPNDTRFLNPYVKEHFTAEDLTNLDRFHAIVKMQLAGQTLPAFSMITVPPLPTPDDAADRINHIREHSRATYARPRIIVEQELAARFQLPGPETPLTLTDEATTDDAAWRDDLAE